MATNEFRAEALKIWEAVSNGLLKEQSDPPSQQYIEALDFLRRVAKNLVEADAYPSGSRADEIVRAVRLTSKVTKFEEEIYQLIVLIDDFYPINIKLAKRSKDSSVVHYMRRWAEKMDSSAFSDYILQQTDVELLRVVRQVRAKRNGIP